MRFAERTALALASLATARADWSVGQARRPSGEAAYKEAQPSLFQSQDMLQETPSDTATRLDFYSNGRDGRLYANGVKFSIKARAYTRGPHTLTSACDCLHCTHHRDDEHLDATRDRRGSTGPAPKPRCACPTGSGEARLAAY